MTSGCTCFGLIVGVGGAFFMVCRWVGDVWVGSGVTKATAMGLRAAFWGVGSWCERNRTTPTITACKHPDNAQPFQ